MKRYIEHIKSKEPHHRRQHAMQMAGVFVALLFAVWITTLGLRLGGNSQVAQDTSGTDGNQTSLSAAAAANTSGPNQLIVASTTQY